MPFPPLISYPLAIDSNETLYLVYNTSESVLTADNQPWSEEIQIKPVAANAAEIWPANGFVTISGELIYYDSVDLDANGHVTTFKRCVRNLGGEHTTYNSAGTSVRGFVVAEHHNQLVDAVEAIEGFIGTRNSSDVGSLDYRIRQIAGLSDCLDDGNCPTVAFNFSITSTDNCAGTTITYNIAISGPFTSFRLDFGDGNFTTSTQSGTHTYAPNATIDPFISIGNNTCQIVLTGVIRTIDKQPTSPVTPVPLTIPIPGLPVIPTINIQPFTVPEPNITIPPLVLPCIDLEPINISIGPISIGNINVPSVVSFIPPNIPSVISIMSPSIISLISIIPPIMPSVISIIPPNISPISMIGPSLSPISLTFSHIPSTISLIQNLPSFIELIGTIPTTITIDGNIPSVITVDSNIPTVITVVDNIPTVITVVDNIPNVISVIAPNFPSISVNWGTPPTVSCCCSCCPPSKTPLAMNAMTSAMFDDPLDSTLATVDVDYDFAGIPSKIMVEVPEIPALSIVHDIPKAVKITGVKIPSEIKVKSDLPKEITLIGLEVPKKIEIDSSGMPKSIKVDADDVPREISIIPPKMPSVITIDASGIPESIQVVGVPSTIMVEGFPDHIPLSIVNPEVEMVYKGSPIEVVVKLEMNKVLSENQEGLQCIAIVPCNK